MTIVGSAKWIAYVAGTRLMVTCVEAGPRFGKTKLVSDRGQAPYALVISHDGKRMAYNRRIKFGDKEIGQIFVDDFPAID